MELIEVAQNIRESIRLLGIGRKGLRDRSEARANAIGNYEKEVGLTIMKLKNGVAFEIDGEKITNPPATLTEKIARAICYKSKIDSERADTEYKLAMKGLDVLQAELNGWQSINRHLKDDPGYTQ